MCISTPLLEGIIIGLAIGAIAAIVAALLSNNKKD